MVTNDGVIITNDLALSRPII